MTDERSDVYLGYRGGSGGFILLHLLLCSDDYHVSFGDGYTFDDVIDMQWKITEPHLWKNSEVWPSNIETDSASSLLPRIFFFATPTSMNTLVSHNKNTS